MTSLIVPISCWLSSPFSVRCNVTATATCEDGTLMVSGFDSGITWIFVVESAGEEVRFTPKVLLAGHKTAISVVTLGKIEVEGTTAKENIALTASEDGEIAMWDLGDGRCLQANPEAYNGRITAVKMTSSGKSIICCGQANVVSILDAASLTTIKRVNLYGNWAASIFLYPTDSKGVDRMYCLTFNGEIHMSTIDERSLSFTHEIKQRISSVSVHPAAKVEINRFDKTMLLVLQKRNCLIFSVGSGAFRSSYTIPLEGQDQEQWKGAKFLSAATLLLWTSRSVYFFYLGLADDIITTDDPTTIPNDAVVLFAKAGISRYVRNMNLALDKTAGRNGICIANFELSSSTGDFTLYYLAGKENGLHHMLALEPNGLISRWTFHASVYRTQLSGRSTDGNVRGGSTDTVVTNYLPDEESTLQSVWPLEHRAPIPVCVAPVSNKYVALGYANGEIRIIPISTVFQEPEQWQNDVYLSLEGHTGPVTALYAPTIQESGGRNVLLSGSEDCTVKVWALDDGQLLASFVNHAEFIQAFIPIPSDAVTKLKASVASISKDHSIAFLDLEDLRCSYRLSGHAHEIQALHWRLLDEILIVECIDGTIYIWQLKTGHLDRVVDGSDVDDILCSCDGSIKCSEYMLAFRSANIRQSICAYPVYTSQNDSPPLFTFQVNIKRLVNEVYGNQTLTPPTTPPPQRAVSRVQSQNHPRRSSSLHEHPPAAPSRPASPKLTAQNFGHQFSQNFMEIFKSRPGSPSIPPSGKSGSEKDSVAASQKKDDVDARKGGATQEAPDVEVVQIICAALMSWGLHHEVDKFCEEKAELTRIGRAVVLGVRGANGYLSILAPQKNVAADWTLSSTITATRLLSMLALNRAQFSIRGLEDEASTLVTHYGMSLPSIIGRQYAFPSFSYLAKYWQDPIVDVQEMARYLFSATLSKMESQEKSAAIEYWRAHLPTVERKTSKMNMRGVIILGIIGATQPDILNLRICKDTAESLEMIIREESRSVYRVAAVELLGSGFAIWEPHINATAILRLLINFSGLAAPNASNGQSASASQTTGSTGNPAIMIAARQAIVQIASANPALFISTLTFDLTHSKSAAERAGSLKLLGMFIAKKPLILYPHLSRIVEAIVKCLDPNQPQIRDSLQQIVTINFAELVKTYPNVAFHHASQKLAVGTVEGTGIVYDVRIAARVQMLEGHTKPVTAVSFSPDGKLIATFSLEENTVRIWQPSGSFLGTLVGALTTGGAATGAAGVAALASVGGVGHMKSFRTFNLGPADVNAVKDPLVALEGVRFEWTGERRVTLHNIGGIHLAFTV